MAMFFIGFATLQTYTCVSREPEAQCLESAVQDRELTRALWKDQRDVIILNECQSHMLFLHQFKRCQRTFLSLTSKRTILPLDLGESQCQIK